MAVGALGRREARPPAAHLGAPRRQRPHLDLRASSTTTSAGSPPGMHARGIAKGDKVLIHSDNCTGDGPGLVRLRDARRGRRHHQHPQRRSRGEVLRRQGRVRRRDHAAAVRRARRRSRSGPEVDRGHRRQQRRRRHRPSSSTTVGIAFDDLYGDAATLPERAPEPMLPGGHPVHVGHDLAAQGRRAHARERAVGRTGRARRTSP